MKKIQKNICTNRQGSISRWIPLIAAIFTIIGVVVQLLSGWPFNRFLYIWDHQLSKISSSDEFRLEAIYTSSGRIINPSDKFSYRFHLPLEARGTTSFDDSTNIWVVLEGEHGGYYLQNPPVKISNGEWRSFSIHPLHGIKCIKWLQVTPEGHSIFVRRSDSGDYGKFVEMPNHSEEVGYVNLK